MFKINHVFFIMGLFLSGITTTVFADEVKLSHKGLSLNANLEVAAGSSIKKGVVLMTHGTLAHNKMEIMSTLQELLKERGVNSLAINLGLGLNNRKGFYDCATPHTHRHTDAVDEIGAWVNWLKMKGAKNLTLLGHSRGGNQTAWYSASHDKPEIKGVVLIAPQIWSKAYDVKDYKRRYGKKLQPILDKATALVNNGKPDAWLEHTDFIYCKDSKVMAKSFVSYYKSDKRLDTPHLMTKIKKPMLVFAATEDTVVKGLEKKVAPIADDKKIKLVVIDGADHSFRDLYAEDLADAISDFIASH